MHVCFSQVLYIRLSWLPDERQVYIFPQSLKSNINIIAVHVLEWLNKLCSLGGLFQVYFSPAFLYPGSFPVFKSSSHYIFTSAPNMGDLNFSSNQNSQRKRDGLKWFIPLLYWPRICPGQSAICGKPIGKLSGTEQIWATAFTSTLTWQDNRTFWRTNTN